MGPSSGDFHLALEEKPQLVPSCPTQLRVFNPSLARECFILDLSRVDKCRYPRGTISDRFLWLFLSQSISRVRSNSCCCSGSQVNYDIKAGCFVPSNRVRSCHFESISPEIKFLCQSSYPVSELAFSCISLERTTPAQRRLFSQFEVVPLCSYLKMEKGRGAFQREL